jgi:hypothetical protein
MTASTGSTTATNAHAVDLVVNTFERTFRRALAPGTIASVCEANRHRITRRVVLINNVADRAEAERLAARLVDAGEIDEFHFVADRLDRALARVDLRRRELEPLLHYSDAPLVAVCLPGSPWLLYWDAEARLHEPIDWVSPAIELIRRDERVLVANPSWEPPDANGARPGVEREALARDAGFALGEGFSDQVFLASRAALAAPIYRQRCISLLTYPAAHKAHVFEARVAAYMRHHGRLRATSLKATYTIDGDAGGSAYPAHGAREKLRLARNAALLRALALSPWRPRCLRHSWV